LRTLGNIIWLLLFFGWLSAGLTYLLGLFFTITVVGAPLGLGLMEHGKFLFWPFGNVMVSKSRLGEKGNSLIGAYKIIITILYLPFGIMLWILGLIQTIVLFCSIVGIPSAIVMAKSLSTFLNPVNKVKISTAMLNEIERREACEVLDNKKS
jgi:uncharacterized membrane protein YccF (DUF307 family)